MSYETHCTFLYFLGLVGVALFHSTAYTSHRTAHRGLSESSLLSGMTCHFLRHKCCGQSYIERDDGLAPVVLSFVRRTSGGGLS